jgi:hypothetical protein
MSTSAPHSISSASLRNPQRTPTARMPLLLRKLHVDARIAHIGHLVRPQAQQRRHLMRTLRIRFARHLVTLAQDVVKHLRAERNAPSSAG